MAEDRPRGRLTTGALSLFTERFRALYERSLLAVYVHDFEGGFIDANDTALVMLGYTREDIPRTSFSDLVVPEDLPRALQLAQELFQTGGQHEVSEFRLRRADGTTIWVETDAVALYERGKPVAVQGIARDITARKDAEERLRASEARYRLLAENVSDVIWTADLEFNYTYFSPSVEKMTGYTPAERYRQRSDEILTPESLELTRRVLTDELRREAADPTLDPDRSRTLEIDVRHKDGSTIQAEITTRFLRDAEGRAIGMVGVTRDISERKQAEAERGRLQQQVQQSQKMESLGLLAGGIAHDFNNLLHGMMGNADLALTCLPGESPIREMLAAILTASRQASNLCKQILAYSGRGAAGTASEPVSLSELLDEMLGLLKSAISKRVVLDCDLAGSLPAIEADPTQLRQVVMNLITNAAEAIGDGDGTIAVSTGLIDPDPVLLGQALLGQGLVGQRCAQLEVRDTGCGMDDRIRERIFDPFFSTKESGQGLGLSAVLGIVRAHSGAVLVRSAPGRGTSVRLLFPLPRTPTRPIARPRLVDESWRSSGTVLLVDDEPGVRLIVRKMLESLGFEVRVAVDGQEGVDVFRAHRDDIRLVLIDESMPRMSGSEAFYEIRRLRPDALVVLTSGYSIEETAQRLARDGLAAFLAKPYLIETLRETLREVLGDSPGNRPWPRSRDHAR